MAWWDELFGMTPNAVGAASAANEPIVGKYRSANGSFDANAIAGLGPAELADQTRSRVDYANAMREFMPTEEKLTGPRLIANILSAASVPVATAQGNMGYANAMTGNTLADQWNTRRDANSDARRKSEYELGAGVFSDASDATSKFYADKRAKRTEAVDTVAKMVALSGDGKADAVKEGAAYLRSLGLNEDAAHVESMSPAAPSTPVAPASARSELPAVGSAEATGDTLPNFGAGLAANMPSPGSAMPTAAAGDTLYQMPPQIKKMFDQAARVSMLDPGRGKILTEQAKAASGIWEQEQKASFSSRNGAYSVQPTVLSKNGKLILGQIGPKGEVIETKLPDGAEYYDPVALAASKEFGKRSGAEQGEAQGKAKVSLPGLQYEADYITSTVDKLLTHPGRKALTGKMFGGTVWSDTVPDYYEDTGDARVLHDQIKSNAFLMAFEKLKGAGAITEQEGKAATQALARLASLEQSDEGYEESLKDFQSRIQKFIEVAQTKAIARVSVPGATRTSSPADLSDDEIMSRLSGGQ